MKFGKKIRLEQYSQWADQHLNYKSLKHILRTGPYDAFLEQLTKEIAKVNNFYHSKEAEYNEMLLDITRELDEEEDEDEDPDNREHPEEQLEQLMKLCKQIDLLRKYVLLNSLAVSNACKKYKKKAKKTPPQALLDKQTYTNSMLMQQMLQEIDRVSKRILSKLKRQEKDHDSNVRSPIRSPTLAPSPLSEAHLASSPPSMTPLSAISRSATPPLHSISTDVSTPASPGGGREALTSSQSEVRSFMSPRIPRASSQGSVSLPFCPLCGNPLSNNCVLICGHSFCWSCLVTSSPTLGICPVCKRELSMDPANIQLSPLCEMFASLKTSPKYQSLMTALKTVPPASTPAKIKLLQLPGACIGGTYGLSRGTMSAVTRLEKIINHVNTHHVDCSFVAFTGDQAEHGTTDEYEALKDALKKLQVPYLLTVGDRDVRSQFLEVFPEFSDENGFVQYEVQSELGDLIVVDCVPADLKGSEGGIHLRDSRISWLKKRLEEAKTLGKAVYLFINDPPHRLFSNDPGNDDLELLQGDTGKYAKELANLIINYKSVVRQIFVGDDEVKPFNGIWGGITFSSICDQMKPKRRGSIGTRDTTNSSANTSQPAVSTELIYHEASLEKQLCLVQQCSMTF
jgi:hypothetical protein